METKPFWKSRKFGYLMLNGVTNLIALWVAYLVDDPQLRNLIILTAGFFTTIIAFVIWGIAKEDAAALMAGTHPSQMHIGGDNITRDKAGDDTVTVENVEKMTIN